MADKVTVNDEVNGSIYLNEQAAAQADVTGYGQLWVKNATPNELWFTDDAGTDMQLGTGGGSGFNSGAKVGLSSDQTIPSGTATKLLLADEEYDIGNEFDSTTNHRFVATNAGKYLVVGNVFISSTADGTGAFGYIYVNGANTCTFGGYDGTAASSYRTGTTILDLAANDYVELYCLHNHGSDRTASANADNIINFMAIQRIA